VGGQMIIPLDDSDKTTMRRFTKVEEDEIIEEQFIECAFVPMLKGTELLRLFYLEISDNPRPCYLPFLPSIKYKLEEASMAPLFCVAR
jgi:hypothetical protein